MRILSVVLALGMLFGTLLVVRDIYRLVEGRRLRLSWLCLGAIIVLFGRDLS